MRIHTLEATGGLRTLRWGGYATANGSPVGTNDTAAAVMDRDGKPVANAARDIWVTETALTTALNVSYMATRSRCSASSSALRSCSPASGSSYSPTSAS